MQANWWLMDFIRSLLFSLDQMVYSLIETFYNLFAYISNLTIFDNATFQDFTGRVYLILGIVMLFKIAFSLISLFANPDNLMDGNKGVTGIVKRLIISLVVITFVPTIFSIAFQFQTIVIHDNVIGNFFLGNLIGTDEGSATAEELNKIQRDAGKMVAFNVFGAFYYPEDFVIEKDENGNIKQDKNGNIQYVNDGKWSDTVKGHTYNDDGTENLSEVLKNQEYLNYTRNESYSIADYGKFVNIHHKWEDDTYYVMHYMYVISTVAGVVVAWIFLGFCFDTAIRAVKLSALQLIAPIPIFSYIDPSKGEKIFKNWISTTLSTYLSLFMRLILIYFVLYICYLLQRNGVQEYSLAADGTVTIGKIQNSNTLSNFAIMMVYIGLLLFAKDAPKLFGDMFGIKSEGSFGSKLSKMGMAATGLAVGVGTAKYLGNRYKRTLTKRANREKMDKMREDGTMYDGEGNLSEDYVKLQNENKWRTGFMSSGRAAFHGATAGAIGGWKAKKISTSGLKSGIIRANQVQKAREDGTSFFKELQETANQYAGVPNKIGTFSKTRETLEKLKNERHDTQVLEDKFQKQTVDQLSNAISKYSISAENAKAFQEALTTGKSSTDIKKLKDQIAEAYADANFTHNAKKRKDAILEVEKTLDDIEKMHDFAKYYNEKGQEYEKKIKAEQNKLKVVDINGKK